MIECDRRMKEKRKADARLNMQHARAKKAATGRGLDSYQYNVYSTKCCLSDLASSGPPLIHSCIMVDQTSSVFINTKPIHEYLSGQFDGETKADGRPGEFEKRSTWNA